MNRKNNVAPPDSSFPTTSRPELINTVEAQEEDLKANFMKMIQFFKEEKTILKKMEENTRKK